MQPPVKQVVGLPPLLPPGALERLDIDMNKLENLKISPYHEPELGYTCPKFRVKLN